MSNTIDGVRDLTVRKLEAVVAYIATHRRVGHTRAMLEGATNTPSAVIVASNNEGAKRLSLLAPDARIVNLCAFEQLEHESGPLLIDNAALYELLLGAVSLIKQASAVGVSSPEEKRVFAA